ncbi:MAG: protein-L-isoaspartate O-methyltransferase [Proteobacteria bacterium]|nr:protein-L-isoaspartate O-methyltransferase [Pseudomonadota bacterium]
MGDTQFALLRKWMVVEIADETAAVRNEIGKEHLDPRVMAVMGEIPRHAFVPPEWQAHAYLNRPLPIGHGKTISQPFIVALMTDLLEIREDDTILEIGTGLGYQTAVLSRLAKQVYSIERLEGLARQARQRFEQLGFTNIETRIGNGHEGWPEHAPFDKVIVTAAPLHVPPALLAQLKPGGRMVLPAGPAYWQQLLLVCKDANGTVSLREILPVQFSELEDSAPPAAGQTGD